MKIGEAISTLENRIARFLGYSTTARIIARFIRNAASIVALFYLFVGGVWALAHLIPDNLAHDQHFNRLLKAGIGAAGLGLIFFSIFGVYWVFGNTNMFRKRLMSGDSDDERSGEEIPDSTKRAPSHIDISDKATWTADNDELVKAILKSNTHPQIGINAINEILARRVNINARNENGRTALSIANYYEANLAVRSLLVKAGAVE